MANALFDKAVENCDPAVMKEVSDNVDKILGRKPASEGLEREEAIFHLCAIDVPIGNKALIDQDAHQAIQMAIEALSQPSLPSNLDEAAKALVDAVERYLRQECLRSELYQKKETLKRLLNENNLLD